MKTQRGNISEDCRSIFHCSSRSSTLLNIDLIPIDLIIEILSRLPAKSIARCRCVWKLWSSIISRADFTDLVLARSATRPKLLFVCLQDSDVSFFSSPQPQNPDEKSSPIAADYHMIFPVNDANSCEIYGHVRGLICVKHLRTLKGRKETVLVVCNPSTGQSLTLPRAKTRSVEVMSFFGYDPIDKQFKVLSVTRSMHGGYVCEEHQVMTLGVTKLLWRMIECNTPHCPFSDGICINGVLYYLAYEKNYGIVCFDVRSEKFKFIGGEKANVIKGAKLENYKGKLATLITDSVLYGIGGTSRSFELCVLEDAEKLEWSTHTYVLPLSWKDIVADISFNIIGVSKTGEIVLSPYVHGNLSYLIYYNIDKNTIIKVEIQGMDVVKGHEVHLFLDHVEDVKLGGVFV